MLENINEMIVPFSGAKMLRQIGYTVSGWTRGYAMTAIEVDNDSDCSHKYRIVSPGDYVEKLWITDVNNQKTVVPAPSVAEAFDYIRKHCLIDIQPCYSVQEKYYFRVVKYGSIIVYESKLCDTALSALDSLFNEAKFRHIICSMVMLG